MPPPPPLGGGWDYFKTFKRRDKKGRRKNNKRKENKKGENKEVCNTKMELERKKGFYVVNFFAMDGMDSKFYTTL